MRIKHAIAVAAVAAVGFPGAATAAMPSSMLPCWQRPENCEAPPKTKCWWTCQQPAAAQTP
jgi:hypothetical protein